MCDGNVCAPTFDVTASAALYAQLAGVLAGFAFFALISIVERASHLNHGTTRRSTEPSTAVSHAVVALTCALLGLIISTVLYAVLSAEQAVALVAGRASSEELLSGTAFAFSIMALLYAIVLLIPAAGLVETTRRVTAVISIAVPPLAMTFLGFASQDFAFAEMLYAHPNTPSVPGPPASSFYKATTLWGATVMPIVVAMCCIGMWLVQLAFKRHRATVAPRIVAATRNALPYASLAITIVAAVRSALWSEKTPDARLGHAEVFVWLVVAAVVLVAQAAYFRWLLDANKTSR
jgi:hypothetical protein